MKKLKFVKEQTNKWYVVLPEWTGDKWELEMVCGADTMLELLSQGCEEVYLTISLQPFDLKDIESLETTAFTLTKIKDTPDIGGALYLMKDFLGIEYNLEVWLCHVTGFVFGTMPEILYCA